MRIRALLLVSLLALGACASTQRTFTYRGGMPDADVYVGEDRYQIWFHEREQRLMVQRGNPAPLGALVAQNITVYARNTSPGILRWGQAANAVLRPIGCHATEVTGADQMREVEYQCREQVNVNAEVQQRREEWRRGVRVDAPTQ